MGKVEALLEEARSLSDSEKVQLLGDVLSRQGVLWLAKTLSALETKLGVKAAPPPGGAGPATTAKEGPKPEAPAAFDVIIKNAGANKINVIKVVRAATSLGLKEAKDLVEKGGETVKKELPREEADKLAKELRDAGAEVEIKGH